ncbi:MAG TPA: DUF177 domain-containing protein [Vicinamibacteria bacterium]|nr:DUF177 domain-containing protein [Vicinamibacteria bacterium]
MLLIDIPRIPPEGLELDEGLDPASLHLEGEQEFRLQPGARLRAHVDLVDGSTVHIRGRLTATVAADCGRCLEPYGASSSQELDLFYLPRAAERPQDQEEEVGLGDHDVVVGYYDGDRLDLGEVVREQIFLSLPLKRLCREDCRGLCATCGANLNTGVCGCPAAVPEPEDPRLAPLRRLIDKK